jgi:hypothetical protein
LALSSVLLIGVAVVEIYGKQIVFSISSIELLGEEIRAKRIELLVKKRLFDKPGLD